MIANNFYFDFAIGKKASSDKTTCFSKCDLVLFDAIMPLVAVYVYQRHKDQLTMLYSIEYNFHLLMI